MSEATTWDRLVDAHHRSNPTATGSPAHEPTAAVLACSDARVPPSVIFDQPAGSLFVVRIAGNTVNPAALASLDYAVSVLDVDLLIVLGHTGCGAVTAAVEGTCDGDFGPIVEPICQVAARFPDAGVDELVAHNVKNTIEELTAHSGPVGAAHRSGELEIRGAVHDISVGTLSPVHHEQTPVHHEQTPIHHKQTEHTTKTEAP